MTLDLSSKLVIYPSGKHLNQQPLSVVHSSCTFAKLTVGINTLISPLKKEVSEN